MPATNENNLKLQVHPKKLYISYLSIVRQKIPMTDPQTGHGGSLRHFHEAWFQKGSL